MSDVMLDIKRTLLQGAALVGGVDIDVEAVLASSTGAFGCPPTGDLPSDWVAIDYLIHSAAEVTEYHGPVRDETETSITVEVYGTNIVFPKRLVVITRSERAS